MDKHDSSMQDHERLGRWVFDGAVPSEFAERYGLSIANVDNAWQFCREHLSRHFTEQAGVDYRLWTEQERKSRALDCLRLLLNWREVLLLQERLPSDDGQTDAGQASLRAPVMRVICFAPN